MATRTTPRTYARFDAENPRGGEPAAILSRTTPADGRVRVAVPAAHLAPTPELARLVGALRAYKALDDRRHAGIAPTDQEWAECHQAAEVLSLFEHVPSPA
jgi:hypothetical protein